MPVSNYGDSTDAQTVIVVDDDPAVLAVLVKMLERKGYSPIACDRAEAALDAIGRNRPAAVAAVIDLEMPGTNGRALFGRLRAIAPSLPVLFVSGHGESRLLDELGRPSRTDFLGKPFGTAALDARLRDLWQPPPNASPAA